MAIDLVFVLDTSGSMSADNRQLMLDFTADLTAALPVPVGPSGSRVAAINFDSLARVNFLFENYTTSASVEAALRAITPTTTNGATATHTAIGRLRNTVLTGFGTGWRQNAVPTVVVFVTDGAASDSGETMTQIERLNTTFGSTIERYAIGVGSSVYSQLLALAYNKAGNVKELVNFAGFSTALRTELLDSIFCPVSSFSGTTTA